MENRPLAGALASLVEALGAKDSYTRSHSLRVARCAAAMARELGLSKADCREIALGAELHDVGKIGIPDELLHKPGPLSEAERVRLLEHTLIGERILSPLFSGRPVILAVVRWHHERMDGTGYPDRLKGEEIPLAARIVAVADAFDAMRTARPYRAPLPARVAIAELVRSAGSHFDPRCVEALLAVLRRWVLAQSVAVMDQPVRGVSAAAWRDIRWWPDRPVPRRPNGTGPPQGPMRAVVLRG
jgi:putative nucleotidyltransferase with HDIG domain